MIIERIIEKYRKLGQVQSLDPLRLSRAGQCVKQGVYMKFPDEFPPDPFLPRAMMVFEEGNRTHDWLKKELQQAYGGNWGMEEEEFVIEVDGEKVYGHIDGLIDLDGFGLTVVEIKSMSNFAFRRVLEGNLEPSHITQLNAYLVAANVDNGIFLCYRKETSHLLDIFISKHLREGRIIITLTNGTREIRSLNKPLNFSEEFIETVEVRLPFSQELYEQTIETFRTIIHAKSPNEVPRPSEYDQENFTCSRCKGKGSYLTEKLQKEKDCPNCNGTGKVEAVELKYPCSYCRFVRYCYPKVQLVLDTKPHFIIQKGESHHDEDRV